MSGEKWRSLCCTNKMEVFSMIKHSLVADGTNPITKHYKLGRVIGSAGPEMVWKIYEATRISDGHDASVFVFEKRIADKLHKPRRKEIVSEMLRKDVQHLSRLKHPKILRVIHSLEESHDSLAYATEPVMASLANLLGNYERLPNPIPPELKDYNFLDVQVKYGLLQVAEGLSYLHNTEQMMHGNVCPNNIILTTRGTWKLAGLGFAERPVEGKVPPTRHIDSYQCSPWTSKSPKMAQPDLDYIAPEIQLEASRKSCTVLGDMFSFGMVICAIYNQGRSIIQANHNTALYAKRVEQMTEQFGEIAHKMPLKLVEPVEKMINRDIRYRPTPQLFMLLKFFDDPVVRCMQNIDAVDSRDLSFKCDFFTKLAQAIPLFPRKLLYNSVFPVLKDQSEYPDMLVLVLPSFISMIECCSDEDYKEIIQPEFRKVFSMNGRPVQATVYLLERLDIILSKATEEEIKSDVLPMIFSTLESNSIQGQESAISVFSTIKQYLDDQTMRKLVLPKAKLLFHKSTNVRIQLNALACIDKLLDSLDKMMILDEVLPFLTEIRGQDVDIIMSVIAIYRHMLGDRKYGLTHNLIATKVMPTLIPHTVCPGLTLEQFSLLMDVLHDMLEQIDRQRRNKMMDEAVDITNAGGYTRRKSIDMRYSVYDPPKAEQGMTPKYLLTVDEAYCSKFRPPSTPELQTQRASSESLVGRTYRRHSSFQGLGMEEQAVLDKIVRETQRRASLVPAPPGPVNPSILVSEPSVGDFEEPFFYGTPRRASTQSMGPVVVPFDEEGKKEEQEPGRRDSRGRLLDALPNHNQRRSSFQGICESAMSHRRPSFQGVCETAMQFFVGK